MLPVTGALELQPGQSLQISSHGRLLRPTLQAGMMIPPPTPEAVTCIGSAKQIIQQRSGTKGAIKLVVDPGLISPALCCTHMSDAQYMMIGEG